MQAERGGSATEASGEVAFGTRVDNWLLAVLVAAAIISVAAVLLSASEDPAAAVVSGVIVVATFALVLVLAVPTRYTIGERQLLIRSGLLRYRVPLEAIRRVYPTRNPLAAPAWSLDRLGIEYSRGRGRSLALISPERREEFLSLLAARAGLAREGEELRRV